MALDNVALVFLVRDELEGSPFSFGAVNSAYGIGMVLASILLIRARGGRSDAVYFLGGWLVNGIGTLSPVFRLRLLLPSVCMPSPEQATVLRTLRPIDAQKTVPSGMLGRAFGLSATTAGLGGSIAYAAGGVLLELTSARMVFVIAGSLAVCGWPSSCSGNGADPCRFFAGRWPERIVLEVLRSL